MKFEIKSDGTPSGTRVVLRLPNGDEHDLSKLVTRVEIKMDAGAPVVADVTVAYPHLDIACDYGSLHAVNPGQNR